MPKTKKNRLSKKDPQKLHNHYGVLKWLRSQQFIVSSDGKYNKEEYEKHLKDFCLQRNSNFDFSKAKRGLTSLESFVQNNWRAFCNFTLNKKREHE
jgi:hypothetical protein